MTPADTQAALAAATATLESPGDPLAWLHARDVVALVACVSALRDVLAQTERERDEARRVVRFRDLYETAAVRYRRDRKNKYAEGMLNALGAYADLLNAAGALSKIHLWDAANGAALDETALLQATQCKAPPFPDDVTRRLCAFLGCDPGPLLDAAAKCEEAMR